MRKRGHFLSSSRVTLTASLSFAEHHGRVSSGATLNFSERAFEMTTQAASAKVISLQSRRASRAQRRSRALREAMRRHPSYQGAVLTHTAQNSESAKILEFRAPAS